MLTTQFSLLIRLRATDDTEAWSRFVRLYTPLVHHWIGKTGVEANAMDDLVQEVFVVLLDRAQWLGENRPGSFRGWLRTVTLNKCRDHFRRANRMTEPRLMGLPDMAECDPAVLLTDDEYRRYVARAALRLMRDSFSETTWRACWEHVAMNRPAREVAVELGITENAVYLARGRVLKRLREELAGLWD